MRVECFHWMFRNMEVVFVDLLIVFIDVDIGGCIWIHVMLGFWMLINL